MTFIMASIEKATSESLLATARAPDIARKDEGHHGRDVVDERLRHVLPVHTSGDALPEC